MSGYTHTHTHTHTHTYIHTHRTTTVILAAHARQRFISLFVNDITRVLSTGWAGGSFPPKCQSFPPNIFIRLGKTLLSNSGTLAINFLSTIYNV